MIQRILEFLIGLLQKWQNRDSLKTLGAVRSPKWRKIRAEFLKENPFCALCGGKEVLEIHHKKAFHTNPELELDKKNLIVLCESGKNGIVCHRSFGHLGSYQSINVSVGEDVELWNKKITNRP